jgi:hypothetical protein
MPCLESHVEIIEKIPASDDVSSPMMTQRIRIHDAGEKRQEKYNAAGFQVFSHVFFLYIIIYIYTYICNHICVYIYISHDFPEVGETIPSVSQVITSKQLSMLLKGSKVDGENTLDTWKSWRKTTYRN